LTCTLLCRLTSTTCYNNKSVQETFTFFINLYAFLLFPCFFLLHLDISCKTVACSKNYTLQSLKTSFGLKIFILYKTLSFGINIFSYLIGSFQNFLEEVLTHNFSGRPKEVGLKLFLICTLEMVVGLL